MSRMKKRQIYFKESSTTGQALLELVIVLGILVLILVALVSLVILSLSTVQKSRLRAQATEIAQGGIERIRAKRDEDQYTNNWNSSTPPLGFKQDCPNNAQNWAYGAPAPTANPTVFPTVTADCIAVPTPDQVRVVTEVGWEFGGKWHDVTLETEFGPRKEGIFR